MSVSSTVVNHQHTLNGHQTDVNGVSFNKNSFVTCSSDKTVRIWNLEDYSELPSSPLCAHTYSVHCCQYSPDGTILATCSTDGKCILWDSQSWTQMCILEHPSKSSLRVCRFSPSGDLLATGSDDETTGLWSVTQQKLLRTFSGQEASIPALAFSPDNAFIVTGTPNGDLCLWDAMYGHGKYLVFISEGHDLGITCCDFSPTYGSAGAVCSLEAVQTHFMLATCGYDYTIKLWDLVAYVGSTKVSLQLRDTLLGHSGPVLAVCYSHSGKLLASGSSDHAIRLWDPLKAECLQVADAHSRYVTSVAFSRDDLFLGSGSNDKTVKIWKITTVENLQVEPPTAPLIDLSEIQPSCSSQDQTTTLPPPIITQCPPSQWNVNDVCRFLEEIGLSQYVQTFRKNAIDGTELLGLSDSALEKALGVSALGHRNKILRSIEYVHAHPMKQPQTGRKDDKTPDEYLCPITREVMRDPVIASDGYTYERAAIVGWFESGKTTSPMTNSPLQSSTLTPNRSLKMLIQKK